MGRVVDFSMKARRGRICGLVFGLLLTIAIQTIMLSDKIFTENDKGLQRLLNNAANHEEELELNGFLVTCISLGLITLTIIFEWCKHYLEESVTEDMEPIIENLFGEMTVLGFLSMVTFLLSSGGFFGYLSRILFGNEEAEDELLEWFEQVHFAIFFIMIFFFIQVVVLIRQAIRTEKIWVELDKDYRKPGDERKNHEESFRKMSSIKKFWGNLRLSNSLITLLPFFRNEKHEFEISRAYFKALRDEFIEDRSLKPPFHPSPSSQRLKYDFVFGRYLGLCLVRFLAKVVDVTNTTLVIMAIGAVLFYLWSLVVETNIIYLAWSWLLLGWLQIFFFVYFEKHILEIRRQLVPESSPHIVSLHYSLKDPQVGNTPFGSVSGNDLTLPGLCSIDLDKYLRGRSLLRRTFTSGTPNHQDTLYWMDRYGPKLYLIILQCNLIFIGLDCAVQALFFLPMMKSEASLNSFIVYLILVVLSISGNMLNKRHLVANLAVVCSIGVHRNINAIADVFREEKTEDLVRGFLILYRLHSVATEANPKQKSKGEGDDHYSLKLDALEIMQASKTFENFATIDGYITYKEFKKMMSTLGGKVPEEILKKMMSSIDESNDGKIEKSEFLQWYSDNIVSADDNALLHAPRVLFELFDEDDQKEISISQFMQKLDALQVGFNVTEQISIINEIDRDGNGQISQHEFEVLFKKFPPMELLRKKNKKFFEYKPGELLCLSSVPSCGFLNIV